MDFTANGEMAYVFGRVTYRLASPQGGAADARGDFMIVFVVQGTRWRVRSYIERPTVPF